MNFQDPSQSPRLCLGRTLVRYALTSGYAWSVPSESSTSPFTGTSTALRNTLAQLEMKPTNMEL